MALLPKINSLAELRMKADYDQRYRKLACVASSNLGGPSSTLDEAIRWLNVNAEETTEEGVVAEVNSCRSWL